MDIKSITVDLRLRRVTRTRQCLLCDVGKQPFILAVAKQCIALRIVRTSEKDEIKSTSGVTGKSSCFLEKRNSVKLVAVVLSCAKLHPSGVGRNRWR